MRDYDIVSNRRRVEAVDLQPYGNTISVETISDNPFEDAQDVEVFTQTNDGFGGPAPASMRSKRIITRPEHVSPMWAGRVAAMKMRAPAHKAHAGFAPGMNGLGLGETPGGPITMAPAQPQPAPWYSQLLSATPAAITAAGGAVQTAQQTQLAKANTALTDAQARKAAADAASAALMSQGSPKTGGKSNTMLYVLGGAAVLGALFFFMKRK